MSDFWKVTALVLVSAILCIAVGKQEKEFSSVLSIAVFCIVASTLVSYLEPVFRLIQRLEELGNIQEGIIGILLKASGVALVSEFAGMVCMDAGNSSLAKIIQLLGCGAVLYLTIPLAEIFLTLIQNLLGKL